MSLFKALVLAALAALAAGGAPFTSAASASCKIPKTFAPVSEPGLPDPWKFYNGQPVRHQRDWECRQEEMGKILQQFELGTLPPAPKSVRASIEGNTVTMKISTRTNSTTAKFTIRNAPPKSRSGGPAVVILGSYTTVPIPDGIGIIGFNNDECAAQINAQSHGKGWFYDLHGADHPAGSLIAWAWCAGRIIDALEQLGPRKTGIDTDRLGVTGCSRNGKGTFVVGAFEQRFALTIPQESGTGGAGSWRISDYLRDSKGNNVQTARQLVTENTWMSLKFNQYVNNVTTIPADHHFLPALVAPRGLFVIESRIEWLGPDSTATTMKAGREIYAALGVKSNMGFYQEPSEEHMHCQFPANAGPALGAFYARSLRPTIDIEVSNSTIDTGDWTGGWSSAPKNLG